MKTSVLDIIMPFLTKLANGGFIWIVIAIVLLISRKYRVHGYKLCVALFAESILCNGILKLLIRRIRPSDVNSAITILINRPMDFSFPSGHTMISFAAATVIFNINKKWGVGAFVLASLIGFSRLYLYVHYPSDVIVGAIFGVLVGIFALHITDYILSKRKSSKQD